MKYLLIIFAIATLTGSSATAADCSATGGKFENVARAANPGPALANLNTANIKINTLIGLCSARGIDIPTFENEEVDLSLDYQKGGECDFSTIGSQSERAAGSVRSQFNKVNTASSSVVANVDLLTTVLLRCIGAKQQ